MRLYEIADNYRRLQEMLDAAETSEEMRQMIIDTMEAVQGDFEDKAEAMAALIAENNAMIDGCEREIDRLSAKINRAKTQNDSIKRYLMAMMNMTGQKKVNAGTWKISIAKNGGKAPIVWSKDPAELTGEIPELYIKTTRSVDTGFVRECLEKGEQLEFAKLGERGESLRIK